MNVMKKEKKLNLIIVFEILIIMLMIIYFLTWRNQYNNSQRELILEYINEDKIVGLSLDECESLFGEPFYVEDNEAYFDGGYYYQFSIGIRYCEYCLVLSFDENERISFVSYRYMMDLT